MTDLKAKWMAYKVAAMTNDNVMAKWEADPENEELEAFADRTYEVMWELLEAFAAEMEAATNGQVDAKTAKRLVLCPKYSGRLEDIMNRWAA